jgi:hypothetical protein
MVNAVLPVYGAFGVYKNRYIFEEGAMELQEQKYTGTYADVVCDVGNLLKEINDMLKKYGGCVRGVKIADVTQYESTGLYVTDLKVALSFNQALYHICTAQ